jgi:uncharacterized protein GlcG (DUF336 family)
VGHSDSPSGGGLVRDVLFEKSPNWNVAIAVVDDAGHLMYLQREKVQLGSIEVAITKARVALMFRRPTQFWEETVASGHLAQLSQLRHVETKNPLFFNGSSQKVCTTFARLFLQ